MKRFSYYIYFVLMGLISTSQGLETQVSTHMGSAILQSASIQSMVVVGEGVSGVNLSDGVYDMYPGIIFISEHPFGEVLGLEIELNRVYPNPASTFLKVSYFIESPIRNLRFTIHDLQGKSVIDETYNGVNGRHIEEIDISHLQPSVYILMVEGDGHEIRQKVRFVKQ